MDFKNILKKGLYIASDSGKDLIKDPKFWMSLGMVVVNLSVKSYTSSRARKYEEDLNRQYQEYKREYERHAEECRKESEKQKSKSSKENETAYNKYYKNCGEKHIEFAKSIIDEMVDLINSQDLSEAEKKELFDIIERHSAWISKSPKGILLLGP